MRAILMTFCFIVVALSPWVARAADITFTVNTSEAVTVDTAGGTPRLALDIGGVTRYATYSTGSGTSSLTFSYPVQAGDFDANGITVASPVDLNGGTIRDAAGNDLTPAYTPPAMPNVKVQTYTAAFVTDPITPSNASNISLAINKAPSGASYSYTITSDGGAGSVTGSGTIAGNPHSVTGVDVSGLPDGTLSLTLTVSTPAGGTGQARTATVSKAPWTPADLGSSLALWLDASDAGTITLNGSTVSQWRDKSGNGRHVAQSNPAKQPTYSLSNQNGLNVLSFDGNQRSLFASSASVNIPHPFSRFFVGQFLVKPNQSVVLDSDTSNTQCVFYNGENGSSWTVANGIAPSFANYSYGTRDFLNHQHFHTVNGSASYWGLDGSNLTGPLNAGPGSQVGIRIGHVRTEIAPQYAFNGRIFEIVLVSNVISTNDRQKMEGYLAHKWGLTGNLPSGHPYKLVPP